jgi:homoserine dehydrogenase
MPKKSRVKIEGERALRVGLAGLGTVGQGVVQILQAESDLIAARAGRAIKIDAVSANNRRKKRAVSISSYRWFDDPLAMATDPDLDIIVEVIGGADGIARDLAYAALAAGKSFVTANKALLAHEGLELARLAERQNKSLAFEASVCGGIPIIKTVREGLSANSIGRLYGILNGTCNYILTEMRETGRDFALVLREAQEKGYAEADPSFDIDGIDTAHKLAILASLAFNTPINSRAIYCEGIRRIKALDIAFADELGFRIKLLGIASRSTKGVEVRVHPCMVARDTGIAHVNGVNNAVVAEGAYSGPIMLQGRGAGRDPTASAIVADLIDIASGRTGLAFGLPAKELTPAKITPMQKHYGRYYLRLMVQDRPGVIASVSAILRDGKISIESLVQHGRAQGEEAVPIVIVTHEAEELAMTQALQKIEKLRTILAKPHLIRIENAS